jgi:hypothetical protein
MSGDLVALASTWAGLGAGHDGGEARRAERDQRRVLARHALDTISSFIRNSGKLAGIASFANNPPAVPDASALKACNYLLAILTGHAGSTIPAAAVPALLAILDAVSADARTGITAGNVVAFNAICQSQVPWWQANGFSRAGDAV